MKKTLCGIAIAFMVFLLVSLTTKSGTASGVVDVSGDGKIRVVKTDEKVCENYSVKSSSLQFCDNAGNILKEVSLINHSREELQYVQVNGLVYVPQRIRRVEVNWNEYNRKLKELQKAKDLKGIQKLLEDTRKVYEDIDVYTMRGELKRTILVDFLMDELFANSKGEVAVRGVVYLPGDRERAVMAFYDEKGSLRRKFDSREAKEFGLSISGNANGLKIDENSFVWAGWGAISLVGFDGKVIWSYKNELITNNFNIPGISYDKKNKVISVFTESLDSQMDRAEYKIWQLSIKGELIGLLDQEFEKKFVEISPKMRLVKDVKGYKRTVQFVDGTGHVLHEVGCLNGCGFSPNRKFVAIARQFRERYSKNDAEKMRQKVKQTGKNYEHPKDFWDPLLDVDVFDENGKKVNSVKVDMYPKRILCSNEGQVVVFGHGDLYKHKYYEIRFYDESGKIKKIIRDSDAETGQFPFCENGIFLSDGRVLWVGFLNEKGCFVIYDKNGEIISITEEDQLSIIRLHIERSEDGLRIMVKASNNRVTPEIRWTWVLNSDGKVIENWEGWGDEKQDE